ncbi:MAG: DegT/DnrJ/EryC1/StrS family aminotransferase [Gammaproteobacteria bacterium]
MNDEFLPFSRPSINQAAIDEVVACLASGWITTGPRVKRFEDDLKTYLGAPQVLALSSATAGLHLALAALKLQPGDEVITTPLTFAATLNTIVLAGGKPVLVDVEAGTFNIDVTQIAAAITPQTRAIVPVHFAGLPVDLDPLYALAAQHDLHVIEDAAHAIGTEYKGRRIGSFGDTQVFSFHPNKNMTTGEGGCVSTRHAHMAEQVALLRFHGMDREAWNRFGKAGNQHYEIIMPGYKYNMMDMQAALGIHQLPALDGFIQRRTVLAQRYQQQFADWPQLQLPAAPTYAHRHAWHLYAPLIRAEAAGMDRDAFMAAMKERNIGTGLHYRAVHLYPYYREHYGFQRGDFPIAERIGDSIVSLPLFPSLSDSDQDRTIAAMAAVFKRV